MTGEGAQLVTGATGFLGAALVLELLRETRADVHCVVRAADDAAAAERLRRKLEEAARLYGDEALLPEIERRCHALAGDLAAPPLPPPRAPIATVWHVAASLRFDERAREQTLRSNVGGTEAVLALAREHGAGELVYMSTAFVAGRTTGLVREQPVGDPRNGNNPYEESKIRAEMLLYEERELPVRILRPSVVVGHSRTHATTSRAGIYGSLLDAYRFARSGVERTLGGRALRSPGRDDTSCNLIPVDVVARNAVAVVRSGSGERIFHLTNATPPTLRQVTDAICDTVGMLRTEYVGDDDAALTELERTLAADPRNQFHRPYLMLDREFDLAHTDAAIGAARSRCDLSTDELRPHLEWFLRSRDLPVAGEVAS